MRSNFITIGHECNLVLRVFSPLNCSYDVLYLCDASAIINKFLAFNARIVFAAESWIWPDTSLADQYPFVFGYRYLNSGGKDFLTFLSALKTLSNRMRDIVQVLLGTRIPSMKC